MYCLHVSNCCFFFKQKTAYEMRISDWSSDVCSSDLLRESNYEAFRRRSERRFKDADRDHQAMLMISQDYDNKMNLLVLRSFSKLPCRQPPTIANGLHVHRHIHPTWALPIHDVPRRPPLRLGRPEERRVAKECDTPCRSRRSPHHNNKPQHKTTN